MGDYKRLPISTINPHLICVLCSGYLIDAATIVECLHTFCKSCIVRYFESSKFCPVCDVQVHKTDPLLSIRLDLGLQKLVYKLAPKVHHREMCRRKKFYASNIKYQPVSLEDAGCDINRKYVLPEDVVCVALKPILDDDKHKGKEHNRYFKCPAKVRISQLIRLLKGKFDLPMEHPVSLYADDKLLSQSASLVDVACMQKWQRKQLMELYYKIFFSKKIKFDLDISLRPGKEERKRKLEQIYQNNSMKEPKVVAVEPVQKKLSKIAPAPSKKPPSESNQLPSCTAFNHMNPAKVNAPLSAYQTILPYNAAPTDIITLNPYSFQQEPLTNGYGLGVLPLCSPAVPTVLTNNLLNSFTLSGATVLPMGVPLATNLICPSMTNPVINQNITNIDLSSAPMMREVHKKPITHTTVVNSVQSLPIASVIKTETETKDEVIGSSFKDCASGLRDREVQLTISETGVASFKSNDTASDMKALPIELEACELLSQIETSNLIDSEDSKESDVTDGLAKMSEIKQEISLIIDNLMEGSIEVPANLEHHSITIPEAEGSYSVTLPTNAVPSAAAVKNTLTDDSDRAVKKVVESVGAPKRKCEAAPDASNELDRAILPAPGDMVASTIRIDPPKSKQLEAVNRSRQKIVQPAKKSQAIGYRTLKSSPRAWNPVIPKEHILKNSTKDRTANKFFKSRNNSLLIESAPQATAPINSVSSPVNLSNTNNSRKKPSSSSEAFPTVQTSGLAVPGSNPVFSKTPLKNELPKLTMASEKPKSKYYAKETVAKSIIKLKNSPVKTDRGRQTIGRGAGEDRKLLNNNNTIGPCCSEGKGMTHMSKSVDILDKEIQTSGRVAQISDKKTEPISEVSPSKAADMAKVKAKPIEENKRKSSVPKKTIRVQCSGGATSDGDSPDKLKVSPTLKSSPKAVEVASPSVDAYKDLHTLQALSSLFPASSLKEMYQSCLPINLSNGLDKFAFNKGFPATDLTNPPSYLPGLCGSMFQNLLLQGNSMSSQDTMSLLASQENLTSSLLNMNFSNSSPSFFGNYIGLAGTSTQPINNDASLLAAWLRSAEGRHSLLSNMSPASPSATTTPPIAISPVRNFNSDSKNRVLQPGASDRKPCHKSSKNVASSPKTSPVGSQSTSKSFLTALTSSKSSSPITNSPAAAHFKQLPIKVPNYVTPEKTSSQATSAVPSGRKVKNSELSGVISKKTEPLKLPVDVVSTTCASANTVESLCHTVKPPVINSEALSDVDNQATTLVSNAAKTPIPATLTADLAQNSTTTATSVIICATDSPVAITTADPGQALVTEDKLVEGSISQRVATSEVKTPAKDIEIEGPEVSKSLDVDAAYEKCSNLDVAGTANDKCSNSDSITTANDKSSLDQLESESKATDICSKNSSDIKKNEIDNKESAVATNPMEHEPVNDSQISSDISSDLASAKTGSDSLITSTISLSETIAINEVTEKEVELGSKLVLESNPNELPVCSTPKKGAEVGLECSITAAITPDTKIGDTSMDKYIDQDQTGNESFSSTETSLRLVMDETVFGTVETATPVSESNNRDVLSSQPEGSTEPKVPAANEQVSHNLPTAGSFLLDTLPSGLIDQSTDVNFSFSADKNNPQEMAVKSTCDKINTLTSESTPQTDPIVLLNEQYSKKANVSEASSFPKSNAATPINIYGQKMAEPKQAVVVHTQKTDNKAQESAAKPSSKNHQAMSNFSSTDDFLQQLQSMTLPQACSSSNPSQRPGTSQQDSWSNNFLAANNNWAYDYACQKPSYTSDPQTTYNQQYAFRSSTAPSKSSTPRAAQFSYNNTYEQPKVQCSEANAKKTNASQDYSAMQSQSATAANHKYNYPFHALSNYGYNSNYTNFLSSNTSQSSNLSSLMSGAAGYNFNLSNPKMFSGQQSYFSLNQSPANNYISGTYGNSSGSNYQNSMNQYGFSNSNVNSNLSNNFGGSFSNFHFPYYNYNYQHLCQGDGLISHHASSLMPSFPVSSRGSLSPRNTNTPQAFNDLSFQSSLFPVMPFVSGLQGSSSSGNASGLGASQATSGTCPPKYSPRSSTTTTTQKSTPKSGSKSRKGPQGTKAAHTKTKTPQKAGDSFIASADMPCASGYDNSTVLRPHVDKVNKPQSYNAADHLKRNDGTLNKSGQQLPQNPHYHMDAQNAVSNSMSYPEGSNAVFDPSVARPKQQFAAEFPSTGGMYNAHLNPNCNFH